MSRTYSDSGSTPISWWTGESLPLKNSTRGMVITSYLTAMFGFSSTFSLPTLILPANWSASRPMTGVRARHGPHHGAQKSATTRVPPLTCSSKLLSVSSITLGLAMTSPRNGFDRLRGRRPGDRGRGSISFSATFYSPGYTVPVAGPYDPDRTENLPPRRPARGSRSRVSEKRRSVHLAGFSPHAHAPTAVRQPPPARPVRHRLRGPPGPSADEAQRPARPGPVPDAPLALPAERPPAHRAGDRRGGPAALPLRPRPGGGGGVPGGVRVRPAGGAVPRPDSEGNPGSRAAGGGRPPGASWVDTDEREVPRRRAPPRSDPAGVGAGRAG